MITGHSVAGYQRLTAQISDTAQGVPFHEEGSIDRYSQQLMEIFQRLGSKRPVEVIR